MHDARAGLSHGDDRAALDLVHLRIRSVEIVHHRDDLSGERATFYRRDQRGRGPGHSHSGGILLVLALNRIEHDGLVFDRPRDGAGRIRCQRHRNDARAADQTQGRPHADCSRHAGRRTDGSGGIRAERERGEPRSHGCR
ncbi:hypothetical protein D9M69_583350 [compost metagenome]